jgi:hypothetical protein
MVHIDQVSCLTSHYGAFRHFVPLSLTLFSRPTPWCGGWWIPSPAVVLCSSTMLLGWFPGTSKSRLLKWVKRILVTYFWSTIAFEGGGHIPFCAGIEETKCITLVYILGSCHMPIIHIRWGDIEINIWLARMIDYSDCELWGAEKESQTYHKADPSSIRYGHLHLGQFERSCTL